MGIELELLVLLIIETLGLTIFAAFEVETPIWRRLLKWTIINGATIGLYFVVGHWALLFPLAGILIGGTVHVIICRREGFDVFKATPRKQYYAFRGWEWLE